MTDSFSSPPHVNAGSGDQPAGEVTTTLAELERKLRELERELTSIGRRKARPDQTGAPDQTGEQPIASVEATERADATRLVDERLETPLAPAQATAIPLPADIEADEPPRPTEAQLATLAELRRFRERLERFATELTADYDAVLARAMAALSGRPLPPEGAPSPASPEPPDPPEPLFEGRVELGVGPFYDIGSLSAFEQALAGVPDVDEVSVRRFEASHAVVDLRLNAPVALLVQLRRVLDADFEVRQVAPGRIAISFDEL